MKIQHTHTPPMTVQRQIHQPRFGFVGPLIKALDFSTIGAATVLQNKVSYATTIGSRIYNARTNNERREVLARDPLGWYTWFMGYPWVQTMVLYLTGKKLKPYFMSEMPKATTPWGKVMYWLDPARQVTLTSARQLEQRKQQISDALKHANLSNKAKLAKQAELKTLFTKILNFRYAASFMALMGAVAILGIGIPWMNILVTRRNVAEEKQAREAHRQHVEKPEPNRSLPKERIEPKPTPIRVEPTPVFPSYPKTTRVKWNQPQNGQPFYLSYPPQYYYWGPYSQGFRG